MDDGEHSSRKDGSLISGLTIAVCFVLVSTVNSFDTEIDNMRQEGFEKHDISIYTEERVEYIHSRITLQPLISSIEYSRTITASFENKANSSLGKILSARLIGLVTKLDKKLLSLYGKKVRVSEREKRAIEFVGNLISRLFGNPGPEDWKQNTKNILAMREAIEKQMANTITFIFFVNMFLSISFYCDFSLS